MNKQSAWFDQKWHGPLEIVWRVHELGAVLSLALVTKCNNVDEREG